MRVSLGTKTILAMRSGGRCALPDCGKPLAPDSESGLPLSVGKAAHIVGRQAGSARHDSAMSEVERNSVDNLLYVCANCHDLIDQDIEAYSVERLRDIKDQHEATVQAGMEEAFATVGFAELEELVEQFSSFAPAPPDQSLVLLPPEHKMKKNNLGARSRQMIKMGLVNSPMIRQFIITKAADDPDWPDRLKNGFVAEYLRLRKQGYWGDDLFENMCAYFARGFPEQSTQCAAWSVVVYMFEACEVFER